MGELEELFAGGVVIALGGVVVRLGGAPQDGLEESGLGHRGGRRGQGTRSIYAAYIASTTASTPLDMSLPCDSRSPPTPWGPRHPPGTRGYAVARGALSHLAARPGVSTAHVA